MRFRRDAPRVLIVAVIVVVVGLTWVNGALFGGLTEQVEQGEIDLMRAILAFNLQGAENRALSRAELVASLPRTRQLFAARDRAGLVAEYGEMFKGQKERHGVEQAQFHVPPAVSFLRLHSPAAFGDDLTPFRPLVVEIGRTHVASKGIEIARGGPAIFGVAPVLDPAAQYTGSLDVGINFGSVLDSLKTAYGLDSALFVDEQQLRDFAKGLSSDVLGEQNRVGRYIRYHATNTALVRELVSATDLAGGTDAHFTREAAHVPYGVILVPIRNAAGRPIGMVAVARDFSKSRAAARRTAVWQALLALFAIVALAGLVLIVIRGLVLRPLARLDAALADAAAGGTEPFETNELCDEMKSLARHHETLRRRGEGRP